MLRPELQKIQQECPGSFSLGLGGHAAVFCLCFQVPVPRKDFMLRIVTQAVARRVLAVAMVGVAAGGCSLETDVSAPGSLLKVSTDPVAVAVNAVLPEVTVLVVNQFGERLQNVQVTWSVTGGGSLSASQVPSDESGLASVDYTAGPTAGQAVIKAQVHGVPAVSFNIVVTP
jgi:hypothetical protein